MFSFSRLYSRNIFYLSFLSYNTKFDKIKYSPHNVYLKLSEYRSRNQHNLAIKYFDDIKDNNLLSPIPLQLYNFYLQLLGDMEESDNIVNKSFDIINNILVNELKPDIITYNAIIKICCKNMYIEKAEEIYKHMKEQGIVRNVNIYQNLLFYFCRYGQYNKAKIILKDMENNKIRIDNQFIKKMKIYPRFHKIITKKKE